MADESFAGVGKLEHVALKLLEAIGESEERAALGDTGEVYWVSKADKGWILDTYAECLQTVLHHGDRLKGQSKPHLV